MKALIQHGPREVRFRRVRDAKVQHLADLLVGNTNTNICCADQHMFEGRTDEEGKVED